LPDTWSGAQESTMRLKTLNRQIHYWTTVIVAVPVLVILATGLLLQVKKHWDWVQPAERRGTGTTPAIGLDEILAAVQAESALGVTGWDDVNRVDVRPSRGLAKVWLHSGWEVQVDLGTGAVLQSAVRRSDVIESLHDGSFFAGDVTRLGVFLPAGVALLVMWLSGLWLFWTPLAARWRRGARDRQSRRSP
jgi:hypothetical protein